jgi:Fic family protein
LEDQLNQRLGRYEVTNAGGETVRAFVPPPLPPVPPLQMEGLQLLLEQASRALGRLDGMSTVLPDPALFLYTYVRKEAVLSSQIEGTQSSLSDLLLFENSETPGAPIGDVQEVSNYVAALDHGLLRLREGFPLSLRLIREIHAILLSKGRGSEKEPGEFRRSQNWIGGTRPGNAVYVPPPSNLVMDCMGQLELFLHEKESGLPLLIKAGLVHVQFETIHPFLDGNGRLGRLMVTFLLCAQGALSEPLLYLSLYLKSNRQTYYDLLSHVRTDGDWEAWLQFFLTGVKETAEQAVAAARKLLSLIDKDRRKIESSGKPAVSELRLFQYAASRPIFSITSAAGALQQSFPTVSKAAKRLEQLRILSAAPGPRRPRLYSYAEYLKILSEGTEPLH